MTLNDLKRSLLGIALSWDEKTFESFPKPLPNRTHIVITRQQNYNVPEGVIVVNSLEAAIEQAKDDEKSIHYWRWRNLQTSPSGRGHHRIYKSASHF